MNNYNGMGEKIVVGLGYRFIGQTKKDAHFTLVYINTVNNTGKLLAFKSKASIWVNLDSLVRMNTEGNGKKLEALINDSDGSYLKGLIGKKYYDEWAKRGEVSL